MEAKHTEEQISVYSKWVLFVLGSWEEFSLTEEKQKFPYWLTPDLSVILRGRKMGTVYLPDKFVQRSDLGLLQIKLYINS